MARKLTRTQASQRSKKGWKTRKARNPSMYGNVVHQGGKTHWVRPNGQRVALKGFSNQDINRVRPALYAVDRRLKPAVVPSVHQIKKGGVRKNQFGEYRAPIVPRKRPHGTIKINDKLLDHHITNKKADPAGIMAHELGHATFPGQGAHPRSRYTDYKRSFGYRGSSRRDLEGLKLKKGHPLAKGRKTRQKVGAAEDFAETFRVMTGLPVSSRHYWSMVQTDKGRVEHMLNHYLK